MKELVKFMLFKTDYKPLAFMAWAWSLAIIIATVGSIFYLNGK